MVPFRRPSEGASYASLAATAAREALADAGIAYSDVDQAYAGWVYADSTAGQAALYDVGLSGIPVINVNNNCATGSTALFLARQAVESGAAECVLALGFEEMRAGALTEVWTDRVSPMALLRESTPAGEGPLVPRLFAAAAEEHMTRYGSSAATLAKIAVKSRSHAARNPLAVFRRPITEEEVLASPTVAGPLTRLMCCPPTSGAAAAIVCTPEFAARHRIASAVRIRAQAMTTDTASSFASGSAGDLVGADMTARAADLVYRAAGVAPSDVDVVELHDCFTSNELLSYESLRLAAEGEGERLVLDGDTTFGGAFVVNPSGGLMSKGHPLGATGLAQCAELVWQLRGQAGDRQVDGARIALQHNIGLGGAAVVTMYERVGA